MRLFTSEKHFILRIHRRTRRTIVSVNKKMARTKATRGGESSKRTSSGGKAPKVVIVGGDARSPPPGKSPIGGIKKPHRWRSGTVAMREIRKYQKSTDLLIKRAPFRRCVRTHLHEAADNITGRGGEIRISANALEAIQEAAESYLIDVFTGAQDFMFFSSEPNLRHDATLDEITEALRKLAVAGKRRITLQSSDMRACMRFMDPTNKTYAPYGSNGM